ncbi:hypothetical protein F8M41_018078 [Gigaspora margarita]|uniref:Uncharacterized protein n=1 Tax=Gigaspora margarita TaxID=4874 RepID=A0A8H4AM19_GIGMA|nr:hypothetical protein F8M41_018078 [Gigaspora margarita]
MKKNKAKILCTTETSSNISLNASSNDTLIDASESNNILIDALASSNMLLDASASSNMLLDASVSSNMLLNDEAPNNILLDAGASSNLSLSQPFQEILQIPPSSANTASILHMHLEDINKLCQIKKSLKGNTSTYDYLRLLSISRYFQLLLDGQGKMNASIQIARTLWNKGDYMSRCIRTCGDCYIESREHPSYRQEKHKKSTSLFDNKDILKEYKEWLQQQSPESRSPKALKM